MDCVRTAIRQKAKSVTCIYRRDKENMPGSAKEVNHAIEEGVEFIFNAQPRRLLGNGSIKQLEIIKTKLGGVDETGRKKPIVIDGSEQIIDIDKLVIAFGYTSSPQSFMEKQKINLEEDGLVSLTNHKYHYQTSNPKYFAGGDMVIGSSLAVHAIAHGRDAAKEILSYIKNN